MSQRILSVSGLRGVLGDGLDADYVTAFAAAIGTLADGGTVVIARDGRPSGEMLRHAVVAGLLATGCRVLDAGIAATPTVGVLMTDQQAAAGLQITASHNPIEWNGLKPFRSSGSVFDAAAGKELVDLLESKAFRYRAHDQIGSLGMLADPLEPHFNRIAELVDEAAVARRRFKVVLDCNHGAGAVGGPRFLRDQLGCDVVVLGDQPNGRFAHPPEPIEANLQSLCAAVREQGADVGFAQDPDADRLAIVDNTGRYIGEELTLALALDHVLPRRPGPVVVNGSTSRVTSDIAEKYGCAFYRSYVGEAHVVAKMNEVSAVIGGEGNGGVIEPRVGLVRDSFVSMAYVLEGLAARPGRLSDWVDSLPRYVIVKDKLHCAREKVTLAMESLRKTFDDAEAQAGDGLRLDWPDRWVQVRASNTEPILRVIAEAPTTRDAETLCQQALEAVRLAVA